MPHEVKFTDFQIEPFPTLDKPINQDTLRKDLSPQQKNEILDQLDDFGIQLGIGQAMSKDTYSFSKGIQTNIIHLGDPNDPKVKREHEYRIQEAKKEQEQSLQNLLEGWWEYGLGTNYYRGDLVSVYEAEELEVTNHQSDLDILNLGFKGQICDSNLVLRDNLLSCAETISRCVVDSLTSHKDAWQETSLDTQQNLTVLHLTYIRKFGISKILNQLRILCQSSGNRYSINGFNMLLDAYPQENMTLISNK